MSINLNFRTELTRRLGDSLVQIDRLTHTNPDQDDLKSAISQQKLNAYHERQKCIEKLLEIENVLDELECGK